MQSLTDWLESRSQDTPYGYLIWHNDRIIAEHHGGGATPESRWDIGSIRKSFHSALVGGLIEGGQLSLDLPAHKKWPRLLELSGNEADKAITLHHLLSATSGWLTPDLPGQTFRYNNSAFTAAEQITASVLPTHDVPGEITSRFARPLGMKHFTAYLRNADFDPARYGNPGPKTIVSCTVRDLLRWGECWLNRGAWQGQQLIPEDHIQRATRLTNPHLPNAYYGYGWRLNIGQHLWPSAPPDAFGHEGNGFNINGPEPVPSRAFLFICPSLHLVAALCNDPCTKIGTDSYEFPMVHTNAWIEQVLSII